ncbi:unnamed protein product, partial [Pylaiella littoralis]
LVVLADGTGTLPPASKKCLRFCVLFNGYQGVFQRDVTVENMSSGCRDRAGATEAEKLSHPVRLFVDDGAVLVSAGPRPETSSAADSAPSLSKPYLSPGSGVDTTDTQAAVVVASGLKSPAQNGEAQLLDETGRALPSLETLSMPFVVAVAPYRVYDASASVSTSAASAAEALVSDGSFSLSPGFYGDEYRRHRDSLRPEASRFCILPVVVRRDDAGGTTTGCYDDLGEMHEIEEQQDDDAESLDEDEDNGDHGEESKD